MKKAVKGYRILKKITKVFHGHGIDLVGQKKFANLYNDLKMNENFVMWLIYELELTSNSQLNDQEAKSVQTPLEIIEKLREKNNRH